MGARVRRGGGRVGDVPRRGRSDAAATGRAIRAAGARAAMAVKPNTPFAPYADLLPELDMVLVMTVEPGFGGQSFMADQMPKVRAGARGGAAARRRGVGAGRRRRSAPRRSSSAPRRGPTSSSPGRPSTARTTSAGADRRAARARRRARPPLSRLRPHPCWSGSPTAGLRRRPRGRSPRGVLRGGAERGRLEPVPLRPAARGRGAARLHLQGRRVTGCNLDRVDLSGSRFSDCRFVECTALARSGHAGGPPRRAAGAPRAVPSTTSSSTRASRAWSWSWSRRSRCRTSSRAHACTSRRRATLGAQVASALAAAHAAGIVHRDVKPANILVADDGTARISDFGIAHAIGDSTVTSTGMLTGTPAYLAPEVARGGESGYASDVFSLGSTLYATLEGRPPFGQDSNPIGLLHRVASGQVEPPQHAGALTPLLTPDAVDRRRRPAHDGRGRRRSSTGSPPTPRRRCSPATSRPRRRPAPRSPASGVDARSARLAPSPSRSTRLGARPSSRSSSPRALVVAGFTLLRPAPATSPPRHPEAGSRARAPWRPSRARRVEHRHPRRPARSASSASRPRRPTHRRGRARRPTGAPSATASSTRAAARHRCRRPRPSWPARIVALLRPHPGAASTGVGADDRATTRPASPADARRTNGSGTGARGDRAPRWRLAASKVTARVTSTTTAGEVPRADDLGLVDDGGVLKSSRSTVTSRSGFRRETRAHTECRDHGHRAAAACHTSADVLRGR